MNTLRSLLLAGRDSGMKRLIGLLLLWPALVSGVMAATGAVSFLRVHGGSKMRRLITLSTLLLAGSSLAGAQEFTATTGFVLDSSDQVSYTISGPDFSTSGVMDFSAPPPSNLLGNPNPPGSIAFILSADTENPNLSVSSMIVQGVPWALPIAPTSPDPGVAGVQFATGNFLITGPGTYSGTFTFGGSFIGVPLSVLSANPGADCQQLMCTALFFTGGGSVSLDVIPAPNFPGSFEVSEAAFAFTTPEPSMTALLLLGFAALGFQAFARMRHEQRR
jgi:hypothetical protein